MKTKGFNSFSQSLSISWKSFSISFTEEKSIKKGKGETRQFSKFSKTKKKNWVLFIWNLKDESCNFWEI